MLADVIADWLTVIIALVALMGGPPSLVLLLKKFGTLTRQAVRVARQMQLVVEFLNSRGQVEAAAQGYASLAGRAFIIHPDVRARFTPIEEGLRALAAEKVPLNDSDSLFLRIEAKYRDWLIEHVCIPLKVNKGACLALALEIARERRLVEHS